MSWRPSEDHDQEIRRLGSKGWEVTRTNYDFDREIYASRHDMPGRKLPTLRIT
jgi:hypothetical protein